MQAYFEQIQTAADRSFNCFERVDQGFEFAWHYHPQYELTLINDSRGRRFVGDHIDDYAAGDLVLIGPNLPHTWCSDEDDAAREHRATVVHFDHDFLGRRFFDVPEMTRLAQMLERARRGLRFKGDICGHVAEMLASMLMTDGHVRLFTLLTALGHLSMTSTFDTLASEGYIPSARSHDRQRVDAVCGFLNEHFTGSIDQAKVAKMVRMNPAALSRFFRKATGRTMTAYINELRVGRASRLLIETDRTVLEVCYASGFNNAANFNRQFARLKGCSPGQFRRRFTQADQASNDRV